MRILGIDIGSTSIKAVELDSAFGRYEIHDYYDHKVAPGEPPILALARMMQALPKPPDRIAMGLPTRFITFRNLRLPTKDRKAIQASVGFELEDELPFPLEKAIYDYSILSQGKQGTNLHVSATLKKHLAGAIETWNNAGLDPDIITSESWAYRTYLNRILSKPEQETPVLLLDIGHTRTILYIHWHGSPIYSREIPWGGQDLTDAIARRYNLPIEQAEIAKHDHGFVVPTSQITEVTPEQAEFSAALMEPLNELFSEIRQAEFSCKSITHFNLSKIYLSGGTIQLPGLARTIEETIHIPVQPIRALSGIATSGVTYSDQTDDGFLLAAALALTMVGADRAAMINFRKGEFAKVGHARELNISTLRRPMLAVGAVILSLVISLTVESQLYQSRLAELDTQLEKNLKSFFGTVSNSAIRTYMADTSILRSNLNKELNKQRDLARLFGPNPKSPVDFVKNLSSSIGKDVVVDMTQIQVGSAPSAPYASINDQTASLTFIVSNPQVAEKLASVLGNKLSGMQRGKMEEITTPSDPSLKRWKVTFTGKPAEDAYGK